MQEDQADRVLKSRPKADELECRVQRSEVRRSKSKKGEGIDSEYRVYRSTERAEGNVMRYPN